VQKEIRNITAIYMSALIVIGKKDA